MTIWLNARRCSMDSQPSIEIFQLEQFCANGSVESGEYDLQWVGLKALEKEYGNG